MKARSAPPSRSAGRPAVSVLVPSHNHAAFVAAAIESVAAQTRPPDELIVIDDGSRDDSPAVIERALAQITHIRTSLAVRPARGISQTRNDLAAAAQGDVLAFLDSDDRYAPTRLARLLDRPVDPERFLAFSGVAFRIDEAGPDAARETERGSHAWLPVAYAARLAEAASLPTAGFALLRSNLAITASNIVVGRALFDRVGGFAPGLAISQDWDFLLRCLPFAEPVFVAEPLVEYRIHATNTSRDARGTARGEIAEVFRAVAGWCRTATENPLCPTAANWPRCFRLFAAVAEMPDGSRLADHLPPAAVAPPAADAPRPPRDAAAIGRIVTLGRQDRGETAGAAAAEGKEGVTIAALLAGCHAAWKGQA
jgi:glycosyltransferase involved in cell wall biosynthesis